MIRFGIVGAGGIAKKFGRDLKLVKEATLTAVAARSHEQALIHQKAYDVPFAFSSYLEMAKSDVIDAVYIATPHNFHYEQAILFMNHQKHVLLEKPISVNQIQYEEMVKIAKKNKVLLMEAMWTHFLPATRYLLDQIKSGYLGKLKTAEINLGMNLIDPLRVSGRLMNKDLAGGSTLDLGIYPLSYYLMLNQSGIKNIEVTPIFTQTNVDAQCSVLIKTEDDSLFKIQYSAINDFENHAKLEFENGQIIMPDFHSCQSIIINDKKIDLPYLGEGFVHEIQSFVDTINQNKLENTIMSFNVSLNSLQLTDRIRAIIGLKYPFES